MCLCYRSRSSSANSETRDATSRSPSPTRKDSLNNFSSSVPALNSPTAPKSNGHGGLNGSKDGGGGNSNDEPAKPVPLKKPEKPERKFNSRELIEKQRNWTSHFSKMRTTSRFNSDPSKVDVKLAVTNGNRDTNGNKSVVAATRSASFNNKVSTLPVQKLYFF